MAFTLALMLMAVAVLFIVFRRNLFERWAFFRRLEKRTRLGETIARAYRALHLCLRRPALLAKAAALSLVNHVVFIVCAFFLGKALEIDMGFLGYLSVFPVINTVAALPLTPGGLGTREAASVYLLGALSVPETRALPLSLLVYLAMFAWSLLGGVVYLFYIMQPGSTTISEIRNADSPVTHN